MPLPFLPSDYRDLLTHWNRFQNRYKYRDQGTDLNLLRLMRAAYYAAISFVDYNVGRVIDALEDEGVLENTLILFTSDHGELLGDYGSYGKRSFLDVAARVPLIVRHPARFPAGVRCDVPVSLVDVAPTCLSTAGVSPSHDHVGLDLSRIAAHGSDRHSIVGQFEEGPTALYMLLTSDYKYVYSAPDRREWLFDRRTDQREERSLADDPAHNDVLSGLRAQLIRRLREDGYEAPLDGDGWRLFDPPPPVPTDPDGGLLYQDGRSVSDRFPPGYEPDFDPLRPRAEDGS
jgi:arylsulfatase A-like enzyme